MNATEIMLLTIRAQIFGEQNITIPDLSENELIELFNLSNSHDMAHIVAAELDKRGLLIDGLAITNEFRKQHMLSVFRAERLMRETDRVCSALKAEDIPFIILKGAILRELYPEAWMRTSSDTDILVKLTDIDRAKDLMIKQLGYTVVKTTPHDISLFSEEKVHIELHHSLIEEGRAAKCHDLLEKVWDHVKQSDNENALMLTGEMFYFYHIAHMAKHFEEGGCGIRPFVDLIIINEKIPTNEEAKQDLLVEGGLDRFNMGATELCQFLFFDKNDVSDSTKVMAKFILDGGTYGFGDTRILVRRNKESSKLKYVASRLFVPYEKLKIRYPSLEKHRWLMPFYQIKRWFDSITKKGGVKKIHNEIEVSNNISENNIAELTNMFAELGLK